MCGLTTHIIRIIHLTAQERGAQDRTPVATARQKVITPATPILTTDVDDKNVIILLYSQYHIYLSRYIILYYIILF